MDESKKGELWRNHQGLRAGIRIGIPALNLFHVNRRRVHLRKRKRRQLLESMNISTSYLQRRTDTLTRFVMLWSRTNTNTGWGSCRNKLMKSKVCESEMKSVTDLLR